MAREGEGSDSTPDNVMKAVFGGGAFSALNLFKEAFRPAGGGGGKGGEDAIASTINDALANKNPYQP